MRIVLLCSAQANQAALANKIAAGFNLAGVVIEKKRVNKKKLFTLKKIIAKLTDFIFFRTITQAWQQMLQFYKIKYEKFPDAKILETGNINNDEVMQFIKDINPDLIMVSGTSMLKKNILEIPLPVGIINLHTGLSPYIKGAPNCTNWCIANHQFYFIGNSIMWIDAGIDSGDLLSTAIVKFDGSESLAAIHIKVMEEAHTLYLQALKSIAGNTAKRIKQNSIAAGTTFYSKDWNFSAKKRLLKNLKNFGREINTAGCLNKINATITVNVNC